MKKIKLTFANFWPGFNVDDNPFITILKEKYEVEISDKEPDLVIYSCFGNPKDVVFKYTKAKKIYFSGENDFPDFNYADYAISGNDFKYERHLHLPLWVFSYFGKDIQENRIWSDDLFNRDFCSYVVSNNNNAHPLRNTIYKMINDNYKEIACGGKLYNNVGGPVKDKQEFVSKYKFNIAPENSFVDGYVTEKITDAYYANTVPIYVGSDSVNNMFNKDSFINVNDFGTFRQLINKIKEINEDIELYKSYMTAPLFKEQNMQKKYENDLREFLYYIVEYGHTYNHFFGRIAVKIDKNEIKV